MIDTTAMVLLAIDTSGKNGSLALAKVTPGESAIDALEVVPIAGGTFSAQLIPQLAELLAKHGFRKTDLAGFAVASGPGSFTGLRVGLAAIKGLAEVLQKPIAAVPLLEALARSASQKARVLAVIDAGRGQFYVGDYQLQPAVRMNSERLLSREEFVAEARDLAAVTPDHHIFEMARAAQIEVELADYPRSDVIARLGWEQILRGDSVSPEELEANYIRRSDAEIFSAPKL